MVKQLLVGAALAALSVSTAQAQQGKVSADVVKIGVLNDRSGLYADLGGEGSAVAARMAVEEMGGKVLGKPIEVIAADHQNKPDIGSNLARQWIDRDNVDVIVDVPNSGVALAVQEVTREKKKIFLMEGPATSSLTGSACSPTGFHWAYDTRALAVGTGRAMVQEGGKNWFFITADYAFGHQLEADTSAEIKKAGGTIKGAVRAPLNTADFSSFLLQAQSSGAQVIGLANAGGDTITSIKQASEFGLTQSGQQKLAGLLIFLSDVHALGLQVAQDLVLTTGFYWDMDDEKRAWSKKFMEKTGKMPTMVQAGSYSAVRHYLKAVEAAGTDDGPTVAAKMKEMPVNDMFAKNGKILANGRMVHDMYLARVKKPSESKGPWDYYQIIRTIPGDEAFATVAESGCKIASQ
ncbi:ABC transporter substrate-binding protein [Azospirillum rugosum]|uniref:Branched-chain amino acid transport system substrate-binding protein n=1 Tax=Azospirillum rugosum TaxID=416170 RepID=A0ABS4SQ50_9PROT|nr:ABC transporter substrate-binding protein [Azospirillum rugosum]MBP2294684.1 branched-chain amino acid transport system substrate-binding protein [Azospirillum rugosum]MDQ0528027.1 branched-chain amino acid transport system substrate-binding protein [Azospirillum rugosum]